MRSNYMQHCTHYKDWGKLKMKKEWKKKNEKTGKKGQGSLKSKYRDRRATEQVLTGSEINNCMHMDQK